jgi:hypothetical protein
LSTTVLLALVVLLVVEEGDLIVEEILTVIVRKGNSDGPVWKISIQLRLPDVLQHPPNKQDLLPSGRNVRRRKEINDVLVIHDRLYRSPMALGLLHELFVALARRVCERSQENAILMNRELWPE